MGGAWDYVLAGGGVLWEGAERVGGEFIPVFGVFEWEKQL